MIVDQRDLLLLVFTNFLIINLYFSTILRIFMKKILLISFSNISQDPRVMRQVRILDGRYEVEVLGYGNSPSDTISFFEMKKKPMGILSKIYDAARLLINLYNDYYYEKYIRINDRLLEQMQYFQYDIVVANDVSALPLAFKLARQAPVILDAHEYSPREFEDKLFWPFLYGRYYKYLCSKYLPTVSGAMTVCQGIADEYERNFGVKPSVVTNAPAYRELSPSVTRHDIIRLIHHGGAIPSRHLEDMIEMMNYLDDRFTLDFMLVPSNRKYMDQLKSKAAANVRIHFIKPVSLQDIPIVCNNYDIGVYLLPPVSFNSKYALPNKFFEFIQARLAVAIGPSPEMASIVKQYDCGIVSDSFAPKDLADRLNRLSLDQIEYFKNQANEAAKDLCAEANAQIIIDIVEGV